MNAKRLTRAFFHSMGVYDVVLGLIFALFFREIYQALQIELPNHSGYIFVPAWFLISGGIGEFFVARRPLRNVDLVIVRTLMKVSFVGAVAYCYVRYGIPMIYVLISMISSVGIAGNLVFLKWAKSAGPAADGTSKGGIDAERL